MTRCFVNVLYVRPRNGGPTRYATQLIARGTGTELYRSRTCDTEQRARDLAAVYMARHADRLVLSWIHPDTRATDPIQARLVRLREAGAPFVSFEQIDELARNLAACDLEDVDLESLMDSIRIRLRGTALVRPWPLPPDQVEHMARALLHAF